MSYETLQYAIANGVATIALNQPETRNALSDEVLDDLIAAFTAARDDDAVRCVVLTSTHEKVFSSGGNLGGFAADVPIIHKYFGIERFPRLFQLIGGLGKPTICAANGHVLAGGWAWRWPVTSSSPVTASPSGRPRSTSGSSPS